MGVALITSRVGFPYNGSEKGDHNVSMIRVSYPKP